MLKIIVIPAFILTCLCIYAAVEEAMQWKYGHRQTPEMVEAINQRAEEVRQRCAEAYQEWLAQRAEDIYSQPWNRLRLWLANIIAP